MERFLFQHMPTELQAVHIALFQQVSKTGKSDARALGG